MKGLAISNSALIRDAHNSLARSVTIQYLQYLIVCDSRTTLRPADIRGAHNALATISFDALKPTMPKPKPKPAPSKTSKNRRTPVKPATEKSDNDEESYHFIGYVPAYGKVWELVGIGSFIIWPISNNLSLGWPQKWPPRSR